MKKRSCAQRISEIVKAHHLGEMNTTYAIIALLKIAKEGSGAMSLVADLAYDPLLGSLVQDLYLEAADSNKPLVKRIAKIRNFVLSTEITLVYMAHTENKARWNSLAQFTKTELDAVLLAQELSKYDVYKPLINAIPLRVFHFDALMCAVDCALSYKCAKQKKISPEMAWNHSVEMLGDIRCVAPMLRCVRAVFAAA